MKISRVVSFNRSITALMMIVSNTAFAQEATAEYGNIVINQILVAFGIGAASSFFILWVSGWRPGRKTFEERNVPAMVNFHKRLGVQIEREITPHSHDVEIKAQSIVTLRDEYRDTLLSLERLLNSEIDKLAAQLRDLEGLAHAPAQQQRVRENIETTLEVLRQVWPDKAATIEIQLRKLQAEQGQRQL